MITGRCMVEGVAVAVYPHGAFGSLIISSGELVYPLTVCRALIPSLTRLDIANTLDTEVASFFIRVSTLKPVPNDIIRLMGSLARHRRDDLLTEIQFSATRRMRPWSMFCEHPTLLDALEKADNDGDGEIMHYNVICRLCGGSDEMMLRCK